MNSRDQYRDQEEPPGGILSEEHLLQEALTWTGEVPVSPTLARRILQIPQDYPLFSTGTPSRLDETSITRDRTRQGRQPMRVQTGVSQPVTPGHLLLPRGQVLSAMRRLLQGHTVAPGRSILAQEAHLGVVGTMREAESPALCDITLVVYGMGGQTAEVSNIPVTLTGHTVQGEEMLWIAQTNQHGAVSFLRCAIGTYSVRIPESVGRSGDTGYRGRLPLALAAQRAVQREDHDRFELPQVWTSTDETVRATVIDNPGGVIDIAVETDREHFAHATVLCTFVSHAGRVEYSTAISLTPFRGSARVWEGGVQILLEADEPCEFVFEVYPGAESRDE